MPGDGRFWGSGNSEALMTLGGENNPVPPVILSNLYSRQNDQNKRDFGCKVRFGMRHFYPPFQTHERDMHGGIRGAGDAGRRDKSFSPVIQSNLYSRQDAQD